MYGKKHFNAACVDADIWRLRDAIAAAWTAVTTHARHTAYRAAINAYTGELAVGEDWPWLHPHREQLINHVLAAYTALAADCPPAEAPALLRAATGVDPFNKHIHELTVEALRDLGDHRTADALRDAFAHRIRSAGLEQR
ncbi:BTAD domain-containing putative transcriptional regulator [Actinoplanes sp. NPDC051633]|uniref:BTAD domain-containing putative transcriptional regulator n=1 Tax=Actinoplanes sp. NPDC051633 TaxID=3155670 RepID=UPI00341B69CF